MNKNGPRKVRKGFRIINRNKVEARLEVKRWVEHSKLKLKVKTNKRIKKHLLVEETVLVQNPGETDDLVMSMIINARLIKYVATFDEVVCMTVTTNPSDYDDNDDDPALPNFNALDKYYYGTRNKIFDMLNGFGFRIKMFNEDGDIQQLMQKIVQDFLAKVLTS